MNRNARASTSHPRSARRYGNPRVQRELAKHGLHRPAANASGNFVLLDAFQSRILGDGGRIVYAHFMRSNHGATPAAEGRSLGDAGLNCDWRPHPVPAEECDAEVVQIAGIPVRYEVTDDKANRKLADKTGEGVGPAASWVQGDWSCQFELLWSATRGQTKKAMRNEVVRATEAEIRWMTKLVAGDALSGDELAANRALLNSGKQWRRSRWKHATVPGTAESD